MKLLKYFQKTKGLSRQEFEDMIKEKAILVNEKPVESFDQQIQVGDVIKVKLPDGQIYEEKVEKLPQYKPIIVIFNKPKGYVVSKEDKHNKTIFELLPESWRKDFYYIGRLDKNSRGLLLLTNDPEIVDYYSNPRNKVIKIYEVKIDKPFRTKDIKKVTEGIYVDEKGRLLSQKGLEKMKAMSKQQKEEFLKSRFEGRIDKLSFKDVKYFRDKRGAHMLRILLTEGKKRHIRRILRALGYKVLDLKRVKFGKYELGNLKEGKRKIVKNI